MSLFTIYLFMLPDLYLSLIYNDFLSYTSEYVRAYFYLDVLLAPWVSQALIIEIRVN